MFIKSKLTTVYATGIIRQSLLFVVALFFVALGVALAARTDLGTSPTASPPFVLSLIPNSALTMGAYMFAMQSLFVAGQIAILRKRFRPTQLFQLVASFLFGFYTDLAMWLTASLVTEDYMLRWLQHIAGCCLIGLGSVLQVKSMMMLPGAGIVLAVSQVARIPFGKVKILNDVFLTATSVVISLVFIGRIEGVREGTVASAFLVGLMVSVWERPTAFLDSWLNRKRISLE